MNLDSQTPSGPIADKWDNHKFNLKLVNPANKRKHTILVVGSGLAGASAAATLAELGYNVECFCFQDSPRRAHCSARRYQRCQKLSKRWRQRASIVLRYG
jgi:succinate dehydrogenase / fumarate reductase flavoprotein subunit